MSFVLLAAAILGGTAATYLLDDDAILPARLCMGVPLGIVGFGLVGYILGWLFGLSTGTVSVSAAIVLASPLLILGTKGRRAVQADVARTRTEATRALRTPTRATVATVLFYAFMLFLMTRLLDRAFFEAPEGGGVFTGVDHNLGDLPFHLAIATSFVYGHNFPPEHPELAGTRLTYPFLVDLVAAMLMAAGESARRAFRLENLMLGWALVGLLHRFALRVTRESASSGWPATSTPPWTASSACCAGRPTITRSCPPARCAGGTS